MPRYLTSCLIALSFLTPAARADDDKGDEVRSVTDAALSVPDEAADALAVLDAFSASLAAGDLAAATAHLHADVLILESGGAEHSREEYLAGHAGHDAEFLKTAKATLKRRIARASGDLVWAGSESEIHAQQGDKPLRLSSTETAILRKTADGWKIVHIHWSSRRIDASE